MSLSAGRESIDATMEGSNVDPVPNSQEIIDMMLHLTDQPSPAVPSLEPQVQQQQQQQQQPQQAQQPQHSPAPLPIHHTQLQTPPPPPPSSVLMIGGDHHMNDSQLAITLDSNESCSNNNNNNINNNSSNDTSRSNNTNNHHNNNNNNTVVSNVVVNNNNNNNHHHNNNNASDLLYFAPGPQQMLLDNEQELQDFAENLLMAPTAPVLGIDSPHYQDIKPEINGYDWLLANLNSTVVNQALTNNPGEYNFRVSFDAREKVTKNMTWTFSAEVGRLYVMLNAQCPFKMGTSRPPPENSYIVVVPAYKDAVSRSENVVRCPHHCRNLDASGLKEKFWMNTTHAQALYHEDVQNSNRHCLVVPFEQPHSGSASYTYLFNFMCRNTCLGGVNRRATEVIFLLQHQGKELAWAVVEVKVCACPGRDRRTDEASLAKRLSMETASAAVRGGHRGSTAQHSNAPSAGHGGVGHGKVRMTAPSGGHDTTGITPLNTSFATTDNEHETGPDGEQWFSIRIRGRPNFEILKRVAEGLELRSQHQRVKKRKLNSNNNNNNSITSMNNNNSSYNNNNNTIVMVASDQRGVSHHVHQPNGPTDVKRETEIVYSDG